MNKINDWCNAPLRTGTTICAAEFDGGVVIGADSRTTAGAYIVNRVTDKLTKVTENIYCCRSGSAADTQAVSDLVAYNLNFLSLELAEEPLVESALSVFRELCYNYRDAIVAGILVAGWDKRKGGQVYSNPLGGMCVRQPISIGCSGSSYVMGYIDTNYKPGMTGRMYELYDKTYVWLLGQLLALAMIRDGSSGGVVRLGVITERGMERTVVLGTELPKILDA